MRHRQVGTCLLVAALILISGSNCRQKEGAGTPGPRQNWTVKVGPSETQVNPESREIRSDTADGGDRVQWILIDEKGNEDTKRKLYVEFERPDAFSQVTMNPNSRRFRVKCPDKNQCDSGPIAKGASGTYKYWQIVKDPNGDEHPADGRIIIRP
jgi:hypothetical protein